MSIMLDIIGSMIIRGSIVLMTLYLSISLQNALYKKTMIAATKQKTVIPAQLLTDDIRLAGYGPTGTTKVFATASSQDMKFTADVDNDGVVETVRYYLGSAYTGSTHKSLLREVSSISGGAAFEVARDVDSLYFTYYNTNGTSVSGVNVAGIKSVKVSLVMASASKLADEITAAPRQGGIYTGKHTVDTTSFYKTEYVKTYWERTLFPQNL